MLLLVFGGDVGAAIVFVFVLVALIQSDEVPTAPPPPPPQAHPPHPALTVLFLAIPGTEGAVPGTAALSRAAGSARTPDPADRCCFAK